MKFFLLLILSFPSFWSFANDGVAKEAEKEEVIKKEEKKETPAKGIISMSPAITETLFYFGLSQKVVGVSDFCKLPAGAPSLPKVGTPFTPFLEKIISLKPKVILTQDIKDTKFVSSLKGLDLAYKSYNFNNLESIQKSINEIVKTYGGRGLEDFNTEWLKAQYKLRNKQLSGNYLAVIGIKGDLTKIKGFVVAADDTYLGEILTSAGLTNLSPQKKGYGEVGLETFLKKKLEYLVLFTREQSLTAEKVRKEIKKQFKSSKIKNILVFKQDYTLVPGPKVRLLMEEVADVL